MKRITVSLLILAVLLFVPVPAFADIGITIDGEEQTFTPAPFIIEGRTLVPMRAFFEALSAQVDWEDSTRTAVGVRGDITVRIPIGSTEPTVNGQPVPISVPAQILDGRTFIPLRFVGEALGDDVQWDGTNQSITITRSKGTSAPVGQSRAQADLLTVQQAQALIINSTDQAYVLFNNASEAEYYGEKVPFAQITKDLLQFWSEKMVGQLQEYYEHIYPGHFELPCYVPNDQESTFKLISQDSDKVLVEVTTSDLYSPEKIVMQIQLVRENGKWVNNGMIY